VGGDALPLVPPGREHCGTIFPGYLSGWDGSAGAATPPDDYSTPGHYPDIVEGVVEMAVCFGDRCLAHATVGVVRCVGNILWRLPDITGYDNIGYCTAVSGLW
jgi:hypothetical protein